MRGVFVTGTGTGVGKTAVAAGLAYALRKRKVDVAAMKPFATAGKHYSSRFKSHDTAVLAAAAGAGEPDGILNPSFYRLPAAPLMAAQATGQPQADIEKALDAVRELGGRHDFVIVEGIGGIMVPLNEKEFVADFARHAGLPVIIVTLAALGTINHTVLTAKACREYGLDVLGIIVNRMPKKPTIVEQKAPETLERLTGIPVLGVLPFSRGAGYKKMGGLVEKALDVSRILAVKQL
jgi:dethiobiotin synthetase